MTVEEIKKMVNEVLNENISDIRIKNAVWATIFIVLDRHATIKDWDAVRVAFMNNFPELVNKYAHNK